MSVLMMPFGGHEGTVFSPVTERFSPWHVLRRIEGLNPASASPSTQFEWHAKCTATKQFRDA